MKWDTLLTDDSQVIKHLLRQPSWKSFPLFSEHELLPSGFLDCIPMMGCCDFIQFHTVAHKRKHKHIDKTNTNEFHQFRKTTRTKQEIKKQKQSLICSKMKQIQKCEAAGGTTGTIHHLGIINICTKRNVRPVCWDISLLNWDKDQHLVPKASKLACLKITR